MAIIKIGYYINNLFWAFNSLLKDI